MTDRSFQSHRPSSFSHQQRGSSGREEEEEGEGEGEEEVRGKKVVGLSTCKHGKRKKKKTANRKWNARRIWLVITFLIAWSGPDCCWTQTDESRSLCSRAKTKRPHILFAAFESVGKKKKNPIQLTAVTLTGTKKPKQNHLVACVVFTAHV